MGVLTINTKPLIPNKTNLLILLHIFSANLQQPQMYSHSYVQPSAASHLQFVTTSFVVNLVAELFAQSLQMIFLV